MLVIFLVPTVGKLGLQCSWFSWRRILLSKQSGCAEILDKCIKTDYWDINAMADAMYSICTNESLHQYLKEEGKKEVDQITWEKVGKRIYDVYNQLI